MKILFLHNNFPAQFRRLLPVLVRRGHSIKFLSLESNKGSFKGVEHLIVKKSNIDDSDSSNKIDKIFYGTYSMLGKKVAVSEMFLAAFKQLHASDYKPDLIVAHSGWGCALHAKTVFPNAPLALYGEWWYDWNSEDFTFDSKSPWSPSVNDQNRLAERYLNLQLSAEIAECDFIWSPTHFQRGQFPKFVRDKIKVIHEGVDLQFFDRPDAFLPDDNLLTYATRGMESMRGFEYISKIFAKLLSDNLELSAIIGGKDKTFYRATPAGSSFGDRAKDLFDHCGVSDRVNWPGLVDLKKYKNMLLKSGCHFYFTRPFVPSWSLLESLACGCFIVATDHQCVSEIVGTGDDSAALLVDHRNPASVVEIVQEFLADKTYIAKKRIAARERAQLFDSKRTVSELVSVFESL